MTKSQVAQYWWGYLSSSISVNSVFVNFQSSTLRSLISLLLPPCEGIMMMFNGPVMYII